MWEIGHSHGRGGTSSPKPLVPVWHPPAVFRPARWPGTSPMHLIARTQQTDGILAKRLGEEFYGNQKAATAHGLTTLLPLAIPSSTILAPLHAPRLPCLAPLKRMRRCLAETSVKGKVEAPHPSHILLCIGDEVERAHLVTPDVLDSVDIVSRSRTGG